MTMKNVLVTGAAGFIGFHISKLLLQNGYSVVGVDALTDYYDVRLKRERLEHLKKNNRFAFVKTRIDTDNFLKRASAFDRPDVIIHLAAQAGVRYSIEHPKEYLDTNIVGSFNVLELARIWNVQHLLMASTSSVYGSNREMPFDERQKCDTPMSFYAATKKANESMAHSYSHIHGIPITMFRFFTVYGPWGRPDMALYKFANAIINDEPIDVYNHGQMKRDFTYVDDLVKAIMLLVGCVPELKSISQSAIDNDSLSDVAPFRVVNIGNSQTEQLLDYIKALENVLGKTAKKNFLPMQQGDVPETYANTNLLKQLTGFSPETDIVTGVTHFVNWFKEYRKSYVD